METSAFRDTTKIVTVGCGNPVIIPIILVAIEIIDTISLNLLCFDMLMSLEELKCSQLFEICLPAKHFGYYKEVKHFESDNQGHV